MTHTGNDLMGHGGTGKGAIGSKAAIVCLLVTVLYSYLKPFVFRLLGADYPHYVLLDALGSYTLIVAIIMLFGLSRLETLRDQVSLTIIVLGCVLSAISARAYPWIYSSLFVALGMVLGIYIIANRAKVPLPGWGSLFPSILWSVGAVVVIALVSALLGMKSSPIYDVGVVVNSFWFQLAFAAVTEEALFRGVIFSLLRANGSQENAALFVQAILFWGVHFLSIGNPSLFFVVVPLGTFFMTWIIKKQKHLYSSIIMHTLLNVFSALLAGWIAGYLHR